MVLALLAENFGDERNCAEDVEDDGHKAIPPTGMFSVDGTKVLSSCAVSLHRNHDVLLYIRKIHCGVVNKKKIFRTWPGPT